MKKYSKISFAAALCLVITLFAGCLTGFAATPEVISVDSYADVGETHWAYPWVSFMTDNGYIHGYPAAENDGQELYKPDQFITRAEFVTILYFMLQPTANMSESFTDLAVEDWYYEYINKAVGTGYMSGYGDGTVKPNAYITREEATSIVYRAFKIDKYTNVTEFSDADDIDDWAYEAIMSLAELGIIVGYTGEAEIAAQIQPKVNIKRAEVASLLANADKFYPTSVIFSEATIELDAVDGGKVSFDLLPKNTSDSLSVVIGAEPEATYTITYTKGGTSATVTPEEFAQIPFTADELDNANVVINFPNAKAGDTATVKVTVSDSEAEGENKVIGEKEYPVTFTEAAPVVTPSPTPSTGGGGSISGGSKAKYTVTYYIGTTELGSETVTKGGKLANVPVAPAGQAYVWYTDEALTEKFDLTKGIMANMSLYAKIDRDRVVEALNGYKALKNLANNEPAVNVLTADLVDAAIEGAHDEAANTWWTNDMLTVVVTNDKGHLGDGSYGEDIIDNALKATYEDVARYVVVNNAAFAEAAVDSTTKFEYITYFRAMVETINAATNDAIAAYENAVANNQSAVTAFNNFKMAAIGAVATQFSELQDSSLSDAVGANDAMIADLAALAIGYVEELYGKLDTDALKTQLANLKADTSKDFAAEVKALIAATNVYGN